MAEDSKNDFALVRKPSLALVRVGSHPNQIIFRMVIETLAVDASNTSIVRKWHLKAAEKGSPVSLLWFGEKCLKCASDTSDNVEAYKWLWLAAERGSEKALRYFFQEDNQGSVCEADFFHKLLSPREIQNACDRIEDFKKKHWNFGDVFGNGGCTMFFSNRGLIYPRRSTELAKLNNANVAEFLNLPSNEVIIAKVCITASSTSPDLFFTTRNGTVKKTAVKDFSGTCKWGDTAIGLDSGDALVNVNSTSEIALEYRLQDSDCEVILVTKKGMGIRFHQSDVRSMGRPAGGVKGITLEIGDEVVASFVFIPNASLVIACEDGTIKILSLERFPIQLRGGKGIQVLNLPSNLIGALMVANNYEITFTAKSGKVIRKRSNDISDGETTNLTSGDKLVSIK